MTQPVDIEALRQLMELAGFTRLVADYLPEEAISKDSQFEEGWRLHDFPDDASWAEYICCGIENEGHAKGIVAAVNALPSLLTELEALRAERGRMVEALEPFVSGASHTMVFLQSREKMHSCGVDLYREDVERARAALQHKEPKP